MTDPINKNTIQANPQTAEQTDWLDSVPDLVREWLGSSTLTYLIINLNKRLGLEGIKTAIIPELILQIATKELKPEELADTLSYELEIDKNRALAITKEIEEKMLRPIEVPLRKELGVDIKMIYLGAQTAQPAVPKPIIPQQPAPAAPAPQKTVEWSRPAPSPTFQTPSIPTKAPVSVPPIIPHPTAPPTGSIFNKPITSAIPAPELPSHRTDETKPIPVQINVKKAGDKPEWPNKL